MMRTLTDAASAVGETASGARETVEELARSASKTLDAGRTGTADGLRSAASSVRTAGRQGSNAINSMAKGTANRLDSTASFVEDCDLKSLLASARQFGRRHLVVCLVAAVAAGFFAGSVLERVKSAPSGANLD